MQKLVKIVVVIFFGCVQLVQAQDEDDKDIGTETITVTKAYKPNIADAFKLKSTPLINDSIALQKKKVNYSIFSVPVASTFTPSKGTASQVKKTPPPSLYNSYASAGVGNPANLMGKFYTNREIDRESNVTLGLEHNSSKADIKNVLLDNIYSKSTLDAAYMKRDRDMRWGADIGLKHQLYNWYGLPEGTDPSSLLNIDERQNYYMAQVGAHVDFDDTYLTNAALKYRRFWDAAKSGENRAIFNTGFEFPLDDKKLAINVKADYVNGSFKKASVDSTVNLAGSKYAHLQVGVNPKLTILRDDLTLNLGLNVVYGLNAEKSDGNIYIYPDVTASYRLLDQYAIAYGGVTGSLKQNTYFDIVEENPYVAPTLELKPTDKKYDAYVGLRGQLLPYLSYNIKGSYKAENSRPFYRLTALNDFRDDEKSYFYGNSFELIYDDVKTFGAFAELNVDVNRNFTMSVNAEVFSYNTESDYPAWNMPNMTASLFLDYQIGKKWYLGANLFYVGEREDFSTDALYNQPLNLFPAVKIKLESYIDANAHVGYRLSDQLSVFLKAANIANNNYLRWSNYPVQGFQLLAGGTYKFDF